MKADKRAEKRKRQRENKKKKLAEKKAVFIWRCAIAIVIVIVGIFDSYREQKAMEVSEITTGKIIDKIPPSRIRRTNYWEALIEYYVDGKRYTSSPRWNESFNIGDCLLIEYSISAPYYYNVLWDRGKQDCGCLE
jgi:hypothetical protein